MWDGGSESGGEKGRVKTVIWKGWSRGEIEQKGVESGLYH